MTTTIKPEVKSESLAGQHPYYQPFGGRTWSVGGIEFHMAFACGYNAGGLIGTEHNGIFILNKSEKDILMDRYMGQCGCYHADTAHTRAVEDEMTRITNMDVPALSAFLDNLPTGHVRYNPFTAADTAKAVRKRDKRVRARYKASSFADEEFMKAEDKLKTVRQTELFIIARMFGGAEFAASRFPDSLYKLFSLRFGHIAHYNRGGFYAAQLNRDVDFQDNLRLLASGKSLYGHAARIDPDLRDALADVANTYIDAK